MPIISPRQRRLISPRSGRTNLAVGLSPRNVETNDLAASAAIEYFERRYAARYIFKAHRGLNATAKIGLSLRDEESRLKA